MWQPNRAQCWIICAVALLAILAWPPDAGRSLGVKAIGWAVDPSGALPAAPPPLPMSLGDNGDAVATHDALERGYYEERDRSRLMRWRMQLKEANDPFEPQTQQQLLAGIAVLGALAIWRLNKQ